jgi:hypothetical protein
VARLFSKRLLSSSDDQQTLDSCQHGVALTHSLFHCITTDLIRAAACSDGTYFVRGPTLRAHSYTAARTFPSPQTDRKYGHSPLCVMLRRRCLSVRAAQPPRRAHHTLVSSFHHSDHAAARLRTGAAPPPPIPASSPLLATPSRSLESRPRIVNAPDSSSTERTAALPAAVCAISASFADLQPREGVRSLLLAVCQCEPILSCCRCFPALLECDTSRTTASLTTSTFAR